MKNSSSYNNASCLTRSRLEKSFEQSRIINTSHDELPHSSNNSQTLNIIRSIVDELYQINNQEVLLRNELKEKCVRFTLDEETDKTESIILNDSKLSKTSIKYQPMLSESSTVVCCLIKGRSKVDCSVSTNDHPSLQCDFATQTPEYNHSLISLLTDTNDLHQSKSDITLTTTSVSSKSATIHDFSPNHSLYSCENNNIVSSLSTVNQLIIPSEAKQYDICQEQTLDNYNTFINYNMNSSNSSTKLEAITKLYDHNSVLLKSNKKLSHENIKFCTCFKRKLSDHHFSFNKFDFSDQNRLLEELHLSKRSLQSMYNDGLFYIHDLVFVFLRNIPQFYQILVKHYYVSKKQANLYVKVMQNWWTKHQKKFIDINEKLSND